MESPCQECEEYMELGIIVIGVDEEKTEDRDNPWRTEHFSVVKNTAEIWSVLDVDISRKVIFMSHTIGIEFGIFPQ